MVLGQLQSMSPSVTQIQELFNRTGYKVLSYETIAQLLQLPKTEETAMEIYDCVVDVYFVVGPYVVADPKWWAIFITEVLYHAVPQLEANCAHCVVYQQLGLSHCGTRALDPATARAMVYDNLSESDIVMYQQGLVSQYALRAIFKSYHTLVDWSEEYGDACVGLLATLPVVVSVCPALFVPALIAQPIGEPEVPSDVIVTLRLDGVSGLPLLLTMLQATNYVHGSGEHIITTPNLFYSRYTCGAMYITVVKVGHQPLEIMISPCRSPPRPGHKWNITVALMPIEHACTVLKATAEVVTWTQDPIPTWDQLVCTLHRR